MAINPFKLREKALHGTAEFPCACYCAVYDDLHQKRPFNCKHHWHEELEIIYLKKGTFLLETGMEKVEISQPCFCFIGSTQLHALYSESDYCETAILFSPSMLQFAVDDPTSQDYLVPLLKNELTLPEYLFPDDDGFTEFQHYYQIIEDIFRPETPQQDFVTLAPALTSADQLMIKASLLGILSVLAKYSLFSHTIEAIDPRVDIIKQSLLFMKEHYPEKLYISDFASRANMNEQYYCRFFRKAIGRSPMQYLNEFRIRQAMKLLKDTDLSVTEIALDCGFGNLGNFMKSFKSINHTTPLQYRKICQQLLQEKSVKKS